MSAELLQRAAALTRQVAQHKSAINWHRKQLQITATALAELREACRRRGIKLVLVPTPQGVGDVHGPTDSRS